MALNREAGQIIVADPGIDKPLAEHATLQCVHCLSGDSKVVTVGGVKNLADVAVGDFVQDASGNMTAVTATHSREVDSFYRIGTRGGGEPLLASCDHPVFTQAAHYSTSKKRFECDGVPSFTPAAEVARGMWIAVGEIKGESQPSSVCGVPVDAEVARFVGLFLAEGCIGRDRIEFGFHKKEVEYIDFVRRIAKDRWDANCSAESRRNSQTYKLLVNSSKLEESFSALFGRLAANKQMPYEFLTYPLSIQQAVMSGLLDGDGHFKKCRASRELKTISPHLAYQSFAILRRLGHHPSVTSEPAKVDKLGVNHQKSYRVTYSVDSGARKRWVRRHFWSDGHFWVKVRSVEHVVAKMSVFNLTTESGTFVANGFVTHNCGGHWVRQPGSGIVRGFCMNCNGYICGPQCEACVPVEAMLENIEAGRPLDFRPIQVGWSPALGVG